MASLINYGLDSKVSKLTSFDLEDWVKSGFLKDKDLEGVKIVGKTKITLADFKVEFTDFNSIYVGLAKTLDLPEGFDQSELSGSVWEFSDDGKDLKISRVIHGEQVVLYESKGKTPHQYLRSMIGEVLSRNVESSPQLSTWGYSSPASASGESSEPFESEQSSASSDVNALENNFGESEFSNVNLTELENTLSNNAKAFLINLEKKLVAQILNSSSRIAESTGLKEALDRIKSELTPQLSARFSPPLTELDIANVQEIMAKIGGVFVDSDQGLNEFFNRLIWTLTGDQLKVTFLGEGHTLGLTFSDNPYAQTELFNEIIKIKGR